jgi:hypothetical protein
VECRFAFCLIKLHLRQIPLWHADGADEVFGPTIDETLGYGPKKRLPKPPCEILDYYYATRGAKGLELRELKLIVVGRGGAGKTSLIKRLKGDPFDPQEGETHGVNIRDLELACADGPVQARVGDFGGQHVLHAMHEFFPHRAQPLLDAAVPFRNWPAPGKTIPKSCRGSSSWPPPMMMVCALGRRSGRPENSLLWSRLSPSIVAIS